MGICDLRSGAFCCLQLLRLGPRRLGLRLRVGKTCDLLKFFLVFLLFEKVGDVEEGVAFESDIDECRLHSRQYSCYAPFVNGSRERVLVLTLKVDFAKLFVFYYRNFGLVRGS